MISNLRSGARIDLVASGPARLEFYADGSFSQFSRGLGSLFAQTS